MKKFFNFIFSRIFFITCMFLIQLTLLIIFLLYFNKYFIYLYGLNLIVGMIFTFIIINDNINPAFKITWILISIALPFLGGMIYLTFGEKRLLKSVKKRLFNFSIKFKDSMDLTKDYDIETLNDSDMNVYRQAKYVNTATGSPVFFNTKTKYFSSGEKSFEEYLNDLKSAKKFIFMEYFIISEGFFLDSVLKILKEKAEKGLDVKIILDDVGSIFTLSNKKIEEMKSYGIKIVEFNQIHGIILPKHNNRTHRKMTIIDGKIAYTGGINIADEYINVIEKYGYWKDSVLKLEGHAVASFINMFISLWDYSTGENTDLNSLYDKKDIEKNSNIKEELGVVIPFSETPIEESTSENMYLNMIRRANRYIYITTPYLIITWEMENALISAAKTGVDVRIITPHIPDKKYVHLLTRSFYKRLIDNGVKIYEFEKGFIHAKNFVCDDEFVVIGSINLDYRSLYLHFECAVWTFGTPIIKDVKRDFERTLKKSIAITPEWIKKRKLITRILQSLLKLFAPLM
ncbi:cardiolipin synthase [uncultured Parvimonas sp.]|uniref:cardiolipin synthase n=1 Tax=uncultured Parvimonas sp. TaxID=747372 RepID=UPI0028897290|nr:cardiolipin synthase [uncultured Parvimonas sp.]